MGGARHLRAHEGDRDPRARRARHAACRPSAATSPASTSSTARACGPASWRRERGRRSRTTPPSTSTSITEPIPGLDPDLPGPALPGRHRLHPGRGRGKLMVGFFEPGAKPWATHGIPEDAEFITLPEDWDHITPFLERAARRVPDPRRGRATSSTSTGPRASRPTTATSSARRPGLAGYFVAAGFNSVGFAGGGGAGRAVADWIVDGHAPMDLWEVDIRRFMPFQRNRRYLHGRTTETLGPALRHALAVPPVRDVARRPPLAAPRPAGRRAARASARWPAGSGRTGTPPTGSSRATSTATGARTGSPYSAEEHRAVREGVGLFDQSSFGKILVQGRDADRALGRICTADVAVEPGRIVYTQWLNERGGVEADVTVTRLAADRFLVVTDRAPRRCATSTGCGAGSRPTPTSPSTDVTSGEAVISVMGPRSRELLASMSDADLSNDGLPVRDGARDRPRPRVSCGPPGSPTSASSAGSCTSRPSSRPTSTTRSSLPARRSASATPAITRSTRSGSRRRTATGATT